MSLLTERWHNNPRTSHAYRTALLEPPNGKHHPTFQPTRGKPRPRANTNAQMHQGEEEQATVTVGSKTVAMFGSFGVVAK